MENHNNKFYRIGNIIIEFIAPLLFLSLCILLISIFLYSILWKFPKMIEANLKLLGTKIETWDAVIIAAIVAGLISIFHLILARSFEKKVKKNYYLWSRRVKTYENLVSLIFKYYKREGYTPTCTVKEAQIDFFSINQQIMLWGSERIQDKWSECYQSWIHKNNDFFNISVIEPIFTIISDELGQSHNQESLKKYMQLLYYIPEFSIVYSSIEKQNDKNEETYNEYKV